MRRFMLASSLLGSITGTAVGYLKSDKILLYKEVTTKTVRDARINNYRIKYNLNDEQTRNLNDIFYHDKRFEKKIHNAILFGYPAIGTIAGAFYFISLPYLFYKMIN